MDVNPDSGDVEFNTGEFMTNEYEKRKDYMKFYQNLFFNENYREPTTNTNDETIARPKQYVVK